MKSKNITLLFANVLTVFLNRQRHVIYEIFLRNMTMEQRFQTTAKICQEILGDILDGKLSLSSSSDILKDALLILASKDIKLSTIKYVMRRMIESSLIPFLLKNNDVIRRRGRSRRRSDSGCQCGKGENTDQNCQEKHIGKYPYTKHLKRFTLLSVNIFDLALYILPIITSLKHFLETHRSPLLRYLMLYLKEVLKDFHAEMEDIMAGDKQLAKELEYPYLLTKDDHFGCHKTI
jgi:condensin-2 complex subunit D3